MATAVEVGSLGRRFERERKVWYITVYVQRAHARTRLRSHLQDQEDSGSIWMTLRCQYHVIFVNHNVINIQKDKKSL